MYSIILAAALLNPQVNEQTAILHAIDLICGDTWCGGDYTYRFHELNLNHETNTTTVAFTMSIPYAIKLNPKATIHQQSFEVSCQVPGYSDYESIMDGPYSLNWDFYLSLTDCIQSLESQLSKVNRLTNDQ